MFLDMNLIQFHWKCMSGNSSGLPISQSACNFYKQTEKSCRKSKKSMAAICLCFDFCGWRCKLQPSTDAS